MRSWGLAVVVLVSASCQFTDELPPVGPPPKPPTCGDGTCDPDVEDCLNCASDCPCCSAVASNGSSGSVTDENNGLGAPDSKFVSLNGEASLVLVFGREFYNDLGGGAPDVKLIGTVTSTSSVNLGASCAATSDGTGAFEVQVSVDGSSYRFVGFWTPSSAEFDIGCAQLKSARYLRIKGQPGASGVLDAVQGLTCLTP